MSENQLTDLDWLVESARSPQIHELAQTVPERGHGPGRRREHPALVGILYVLVAGGVTGSHRSAALLLGSERMWRLVRLTARASHGTRLSRRPPTRWQLESWRSHLAGRVDLLRESARGIAVRQAVEAGCFELNGTPTNLRRSDVLYADGKVVRSPLLAPAVEARRARGERVDTGTHKQAGEDSGVYVVGSKFLFVGTRASEADNARLTLDVAHLPPGKGYGGEAGAGVAMIGVVQRLVAEQGGAVRTVCYDTALRGTHIDRLMKRGLVVLSPVHKSSGKPAAFETVACPCGQKHKIFTGDGALGEELVLDTGEKHFEPYPDKRPSERRSRDAWRWYKEFTLPCGRPFLVRLDSTDEGRRAGRNVPERVRQHAPGGQVYKDCYGWRQDVESSNNTLGHTLYGNRCILYGNRCIALTWERQLLSMVGFMLARNVLAAYALNRERLRSTA